MFSCLRGELPSDKGKSAPCHVGSPRHVHTTSVYIPLWGKAKQSPARNRSYTCIGLGRQGVGLSCRKSLWLKRYALSSYALICVLPKQTDNIWDDSLTDGDDDPEQEEAKQSRIRETTVSSHKLNSQKNNKSKVSNPIFKYIELCVKPW